MWEGVRWGVCTDCLILDEMLLYWFVIRGDHGVSKVRVLACCAVLPIYDRCGMMISVFRMRNTWIHVFAEEFIRE